MLMALNAVRGGEPMTTHGRSSSKRLQHRRLSSGFKKFHVSPVSLSTMRSKLVPATMPFLLFTRLIFSLALGGLKSSVTFFSLTFGRLKSSVTFFPASFAVSPLMRHYLRTSSLGDSP